MATGDLTTIANFKQYAGVSGAADDAMIARMITAFSAFSVGVMNRNILSAAYTEVLDGVDNMRFQLHNYPIISVSSVVIDGTAVPLAANSLSAGYTVSKDAIGLNGYVFNRGFQNCVIAYTAGFATVPADIEEAVLETMAIRYKERDRIGYQSKSLAGETVTFFIKDMPASAANVFNNYRRVAPLT